MTAKDELYVNITDVFIQKSLEDDGWFVCNQDGRCLRFCFTRWGAVRTAKGIIRKVARGDYKNGQYRLYKVTA